ncbi:unnamed protein product [Calypogeia fissa]
MALWRRCSGGGALVGERFGGFCGERDRGRRRLGRRQAEVGRQAEQGARLAERWGGGFRVRRLMAESSFLSARASHWPKLLVGLSSEFQHSLWRPEQRWGGGG